MRRDLATSELPSVVADALRRKPRGGRKIRKSQNNYIAECVLSNGKIWGNKAGAGARPGNRNAQTHGRTTAANKALRAEGRRLVRESQWLLALAGHAITALEVRP